MLRQCSAGNAIGAEGAGVLAGALGQCSTLVKLHLGANDIGYAGAWLVLGCWRGCLGSAPHLPCCIFNAIG